MEDDEARQEFVLEDTGLIWRGKDILRIPNRECSDLDLN